MSDPVRPSQQSYTLTDLDQVKVLADPLRLRILKLFCEEPRTTKQVASLLDEKPTRLYHHVDALEAAGLITLHHTRPNRGTLEKYYLAVARTFRTDASLFTVEEETEPSWAEMGASILESAAADLRALGNLAVEDGDRECALLARVLVQAPKAQIRAVQERLQAWLQELQDLSEEEPGEQDSKEEEYNLALAFYPSPRTPSTRT